MMRCTLLLLALVCANAFVVPSRPRVSETALFADRREFLNGFVAFAVGTTAAAAPAGASYSAYTHREQDWEQRTSKGEVKYSTARDLRKQLREIVPQNSEGSKMFCPNGPSSNVSPMMENKCGDALAMPSVFGRQDDALGNSIPGARGAYTSASVGGGGTSISANVGGFPSYK